MRTRFMRDSLGGSAAPVPPSAEATAAIVTASADPSLSPSSVAKPRPASAALLSSSSLPGLVSCGGSSCHCRAVVYRCGFGRRLDRMSSLNALWRRDSGANRRRLSRSCSRSSSPPRCLRCATGDAGAGAGGGAGAVGDAGSVGGAGAVEDAGAVGRVGDCAGAGVGEATVAARCDCPAGPSLQPVGEPCVARARVKHLVVVACCG